MIITNRLLIGATNVMFKRYLESIGAISAHWIEHLWKYFIRILEYQEEVSSTNKISFLQTLDPLLILI